MVSQPARRRIALVGAALALLAGSARADVVGSGIFDIDLNVGIPTTTFNGMIEPNSEDRTVFGQSVNLATAPGDLTYDGTAQVNLASRSATFELTAQAGTFSFDASGAGACDATGCLNGLATFAGRFDAITDPMNVLPDGIYTFDGTIFVEFAGTGTGGTFGINAFEAKDTPAGTDVLVSSGPTSFFDSREGIVRSFEASVRYPSVGGAGTTSFVAFSAIPGTIPDGYELAPGLSVFIDVFTSATGTGAADVCVTVADENPADGLADGTTFPVAQLRVLHAAAAGQPFTDVTNPTSPAGFLCGNVSSLSPFVLAIDPSLSGSTTTTITPGGTTTTTTLPLGGCSDPVACVDAALAASLCQGEQINPKLAAAIATKLGKARALLQKAGTVTAAKVAKPLAKARRQLDKLGGKADAFVTKKKGPISAGCRDSIRAALDQIGQAITDNPPTGTGGGGGGGAGVRTTIPGRPPFQGGGFFYDTFPIYAQGCETFPGSDECKRLVTLSISNSPLGTPQTIVQPESVVPFVTYSEYPSPSPSALADIVYSSTTGTVIEVTGLSNGRLQGRFSGTFAETHPGGGGSVEIEGTFNVPQQQPPF